VRSHRTALACFLALCLTPAVRAAEPVLRLVDEHGLAIDEPLSVCFQVELASRCADVKPGAAVPLPPAFASVRAEGAHHGPVSVRDRELRPAADGGRTLSVPRKALLHIDKPPSDPLTLTAFLVRAESFRNAVAHGVVGPAGIEVPSGDLVLALEAKGHAPDLQRLTAIPGSRVSVTYKVRDGWSLLVRCREARGGGSAVAGAQVSTSGRAEQTGGDGLALLNGLGPAEPVKVRHPRYLALDLAAPPAEPGIFLVSEALLERGGSVVAHVQANGRPAAETFCTVLAGSGGRASKLAEGVTGADGFYRSSRLPAGSYTLRVSMPQSHSFTDQPFTVKEGEDLRLDVDLGAIHIAGRVTRGGEPASGYTVEGVADDGSAASGGLPTVRATTNQQGEYTATVWSPGEYIFRLRAPNGNPVGAERRVSLGRPEESVDFDLSGATVSGRVVDDKGEPVEAAQVTLSWNGGRITGLSGQGGAFELLAETEGMAVISAQKTGVGAAIEQRITVSRDGSSGVTLVIQRAGAKKQ
jgi:hypothetical protein